MDPLVTSLAWCIDRDLYKVIGYSREQGRVLVELQEQQNKQIQFNNSQRMQAAVLSISIFLLQSSSYEGLKSKIKRPFLRESLSPKCLRRSQVCQIESETISLWGQKELATKKILGHFQFQ